MAFQCTLCSASFKQRNHLTRHMTGVHVGVRNHICSTCQRSFSRKEDLIRHERKHGVEEMVFPCDECDNVFLRKDSLLRHLKTHRPVLERAPSASSTTSTVQPIDSSRKRRCTDSRNTSNEDVDEPPTKRPNIIASCNADNQGESTEQDRRPDEPTDVDGNQMGESTERAPTDLAWQEDALAAPEVTNMPESADETQNCDPGDLRKLYRRHWRDIRSRFQTRGKIRNTFNLRLQTMDKSEIHHRAEQVFDRQTTAFKINVGFGFFLRNVETCQLQYYYASNNTRLLPEPALITDKGSFLKFLDALSASDSLEHVRRARPNSRWVVELLTNVVFYVYKLKGHPIGKPVPTLPKYVTEKKAVVAVQKNRQSGKPYADNLCFFRCLALHQGATTKSLEKAAKRLFRQMYAGRVANFKGITLDELLAVESKFKLNINVYELFKDEGDACTNNESPPSADADNPTEKDKSSENAVGEMARLVRRSLNQYEDTMYLNLFADHFSYIRDIHNYTSSYQCRKCLKLWQHRGMLHRHETTCDGPGVRHTFPGGIYVHNKSVFELLDEEGVHIPEYLRYHPHRAVFDFECCFEKTDQTPSTTKLAWEAKHIPMSVSVCSNVRGHEDPRCFISDGSSTHLMSNMMNYLTEIAEQSCSILQEVYAPYIQQIEARVTAEAEEFEKLCLNREKNSRPRQHHLKTLLDKLTAFYTELPVIGFNSGSYDLNLVKEFLFPWMVRNDPLKFIVKRNNTYMSVKSKNLLFLDITNFLAPGFSYADFLKAYDCSQQKGFFPYEWISFKKLSDSQLPPHESFYSDLKKSNISDEEYAYCQDVWQTEGMQKVSDFLEWYNNRDVFPFIEALGKMATFYRERRIDVFKDGISVPGLTMKYLFQMAKDEPFALFGEVDRDLYYTFRENLVGGPSIIFNRHQEKGTTTIRDTSNICEKIIGYDANALYLWALMQQMPTGPFLRRKEETGFKVERSRPISIEWLEWCGHRDGVHIRHRWNDTEKRVGMRRIPVDGFCSETNTVYQFHGCYWHGHVCITHKCKGEKDERTMQKRRHQTKDIRDYIHQLGYNYEEIYECQFQRQRSDSMEMSTFVETLRLPMEQVRQMKPETIIDAIRDDRIFGAIECDIHVPDELKPVFAEMCPIFKNTEISVDDIGEHMKSFAKQNNTMPKPRRSLIGSMFGVKILLATPLVKWYLQKGLKITKIYQVVEFAPKACFSSFGEAVSEARREGDKDKSKAIIADTMKLIGNSSYGKTITNKENHRNIHIVDEDKASRLINQLEFRDLNEISPSCYEVESAKRTIAMDLPLQIGFFVYQYAKLRMLQFYYDFLDKYFDRNYWEYVEMDTDSAYIAIAADNLEEILKPQQRDAYQRDKHNWFPRDDSEEHRRYDKRTPGLFKVEWEGDGIVALNSKMYYCYGDEKDKFSCKGINKKRNDVRKEIYLEVLRTKTSQTGENKGFRVKENHVYTYTQVKSGFTYFYPKRKVLGDGVRTTYLDI